MGRPLLLDREEMNLAELVQQVAAEYKPAAERHEIRVDIESPESIGEWDRPRLERVLSNLVSNAIKFSPDGGRITVRVRDERHGDVPWVAIEVEDQGVGIPANDLPHVFERFFRASNVTGTIEGTGRGLAGASQIVEQHGGTLTVESREGQGSTFTVLLPLVADVENADTPRGERSPAVAAS
jgi:signal transduction histidine kinase